MRESSAATTAAAAAAAAAECFGQKEIGVLSLMPPMDLEVEVGVRGMDREVVLGGEICVDARPLLVFVLVCGAEAGGDSDRVGDLVERLGGT